MQIGRGAMGTVYEGFDPVIGRRVAIKTLRTEMFETRQMADVLARFKREAQSAGRLSHPHIVTIHEYGEHEGTAYIVMEYLNGNELGHELNRGVRFSLEDTVRIMTQLLGALTHAHDNKVVHRDLKPANMFVLEDGSLKVVDFGIAHVEASDLTDTGAMLGTPAYMSPEQCLGTLVDHRSDIFSAGVILYQLLTGDRPFTGSVTTIIQKVLRQEPLPPSELNPTLSDAWDKVVARAMAKKPEARYESARQFAEAIKTALAAGRAHEDESRRQAAEAEEHAHRAAEERSRAESLRRADDERREAERRAQAEITARKAAETRVIREAEERTVAMANPRGRRAPAVAAAIVVAVAVLGAVLYTRQNADEQAAKAETARVAAEARVREESEKRAKAEALAREEGDKRSKLESDAAKREADARREAELVAKARAEGEAKKGAEEKAQALALRKEEDERKKAELAAKKGAEERAKADAAKKAEESRQAARRPGAVFQDCPDCPRMVVIPAGEFTMGSPASEAGRDADEGPQRTVRITRPIAMGRTEVTQGEWRALMGNNPSRFPNCGDDCPVENVNWNDAREFARRLSEKSGKRYRLPSEAEWEYACRAGGSEPYCGGSGVDALAWYDANSGSRTQRVAQKRPNAFGLYDMSGNVWEWTEDCVNENYAGAPADGTAWLTGNCSARVNRGGSWFSDPRSVRSANRDWYTSVSRNGSDGFRLARTLE
jgi:formylglycine-generating enzyme required for sulfatase activity